MIKTLIFLLICIITSLIIIYLALCCNEPKPLNEFCGVDMLYKEFNNTM